MDNSGALQGNGSLAIDLGSSNTVLAYRPPASEQRDHLLRLPAYSLAHEPIVPTLLYLLDGHEKQPQSCLVGRQVLEAGLLEQWEQRPDPTVTTDQPGDNTSGDGSCDRLHYQFKRLIGCRPHSQAVERAEQAGALFLKCLWQSLPMQPQRLVLTAPVETFAGYRRWLLEQGRSLGVPELALLDEPTAAAIGSGLPPGSRVLVMDLGAGTSDFALVQVQGGEGHAAPVAQLLRFAGRNLGTSSQRLRMAEVISKAGAAIGGRDLDMWIAEHLASTADTTVPINAAAPLPEAWIRAGEQLKCELSSSDRATATVPCDSGHTAWRLERSDLNTLLQERGVLRVLDGLLARINMAARREGLDLQRLDGILPVGGGSRLLLVRRWITERFPNVPCFSENPLSVVASGALTMTPNVQVKDVLSRGVALRYWDRRQRAYRWHPLYWPGQPWPTAEPLDLRLAPAHPDQPALEIVLGELQPEMRREIVVVDGLPQLLDSGDGEPVIHRWPESLASLPLPSGCRPEIDALLLQFTIDKYCHLQLRVTPLVGQQPACQQDLGMLG